MCSLIVVQRAVIEVQNVWSAECVLTLQCLLQGLKRVDPVYALPVEVLERLRLPVWRM
jgi:hypothetical protein